MHLTVEQTAEELGLTPKAVRQRIARGQLPYRRLGRRILLSLEFSHAPLIGRAGHV